MKPALRLIERSFLEHHHPQRDTINPVTNESVGSMSKLFLYTKS
jgi:hypothetical protein